MVPLSGVALIALALLSSPSITTPVTAALTNFTVDDTNSTFWTWVGTFHSVTPSTPCSECHARPDPSKALRSTWNDGFLNSGSFSFKGIAVYIYGIDVQNPANISFSLNDPPLKSFHYQDTRDPNIYIYDSLFFQAINLTPDTQHTVTWVLEKGGLGEGGSALFDYAMHKIHNYNGGSHFRCTAPSDDRTRVPRSHTTVIVAVVVGSIGGLLLLGIILFLLRRRKRSRLESRDSEDVHDKSVILASEPFNYSVKPFQPVQPNPVQVPSGNAPSELSPPSQDPSSLDLSVPSGSTNTKREPVVLCWDPPSHELAIEERLRHLEALAAASSSPPAYQ
ncbi:hypothetical protein C8J57DRAFT_1643721 [Mycena rebaudengoi]|nr:hypothetical protein C8J57DRAFT_1643721 [Mycena rebaudengoi]